MDPLHLKANPQGISMYTWLFPSHLLAQSCFWLRCLTLSARVHVVIPSSKEFPRMPWEPGDIEWLSECIDVVPRRK